MKNKPSINREETNAQSSVSSRCVLGVETSAGCKHELCVTAEELRGVNDELEKQKELLHELDTNLANLFNAVDLPVVVVDAQQHIHRFTPQARALVGLQAEDIGRPLQDLQVRINFPQLQEVIAQVIAAGAAQEFEVQTQGGDWYRLAVRPYRTPAQDNAGAMLTFMDIDKLKNDVMKAQWARDCGKSIIEAVAVPLMMLDHHGVVLSANAAFYRLIDYSVDKLSGELLLEMNQRMWNFEPLRTSLQEMLDGQKCAHTFETQHTLGGARLKHLVFSMQIVNFGAEQRALLLSIQDISQWRAAEAERIVLLKDAIAAKDEAEQANRAKDQFLATLSHELRTPLSAISMQAQLIGLRAADDEALLKASEVIKRGVHLQVQLIEDLLDVSRIVSGKLHMNMRPTSLRAVLRTAIETTSAAANKKNIFVRAALTSDTDLLCADHVRLQQVFCNLLTNAIKFSPAGGNVGVRFVVANKKAQVQVIDAGRGIDAEFLPKLFSPFTQEESSKSRQHGGLGLGLAIVRHLVEQHGGKVEAASPGSGYGATFTVTLPLGLPWQVAAPPSGGSETAGPPNPRVYKAKPGALQGLNILLVDDDDMVRLSMNDMLTFLGARTRAVSGPKQALRALDEEIFDLLLCDIAMPQMNGYQLLRDIRRRSALAQQKIPAIAVTAFASRHDQLQAQAAGFASHIAKPVSSKILVQAVLASARQAKKPAS